MSSSKENALGRWLRVGALSLSVLGPSINILTSRLRTHIEAEEALSALHKAQEEAAEAADAVQGGREDLPDFQERLQSLGFALADVLAELRETPYGQEIARRSGNLVEELKTRGDVLSQTVAEQRNQLARDLAKRGSQLTHDLAERSGEFSQALSQRGRKVTQDLIEQERSFWVAFGFGIGLTAAGIVTYVLWYRRLKQQNEEGPAIQIPSVEELLDSGQTGNGVVPQHAHLVGVVHTMRYYPAETSLDQLTADGEQSVDVIYFASKEEAEAKGFSAAQD
ncbi:MAG TPA: hypothetical protein VL461_11890 [Dictyobacter sp.]|jgi:hypothetical protein|nr:hypothetical protein [Dictyobacter sp.]